MHREEQIMDRVIQILGPITSARVTRGRIRPESAKDLPALGVYLGADAPVEPESGTSFQKMDSDLEIKLVAIVTGRDDELDGQLSSIRAEATQLIMANETLGLPFVILTEEGRAEEPGIEGDARTFIAVREMAWTVTYRRDRRDPT